MRSRLAKDIAWGASRECASHSAERSGERGRGLKTNRGNNRGATPGAPLVVAPLGYSTTPFTPCNPHWRAT